VAITLVAQASVMALMTGGGVSDGCRPSPALDAQRIRREKGVPETHRAHVVGSEVPARGMQYVHVAGRQTAGISVS